MDAAAAALQETSFAYSISKVRICVHIHSLIAVWIHLFVQQQLHASGKGALPQPRPLMGISFAHMCVIDSIRISFFVIHQHRHV